MLQALDGERVLRRMSVDIDEVLQGSQQRLLAGLEYLMEDAQTLLSLLPPEALAAPSGSYTRHLVYADELGRYSAMLLVWHPGQHSPVHAHKTWCTYKVLQGELAERHYTWDPQAGVAVPCGEVARIAGDVVSAAAGLANIHRLGNDSGRVAVSLHIYGVERDRINTHINLLLHEA